MSDSETMTPIQCLRSIFASGCKMDPYFMDQFDRWVENHTKQIRCTFTVYDPPGPGQAHIEDVLKRNIAESAFAISKRKTVRCWGQPPHQETTMSIQVIT